MALSRAHTSAKAADHEKLLVLNNRLVKYTECCSYDLALIPTNSLSPSIGRRVVTIILTYTLTITIRITTEINGFLRGPRATFLPNFVKIG